MVSCTASRSNNPGRHGITTSVADSMASRTLTELFGGVSMKTHSIGFCLALLTKWAMSRFTILSGGADSERCSFHSDREPCGSSLMSRHDCISRCTCNARCAAKVLFPVPPLRDAKASTFITRTWISCDDSQWGADLHRIKLDREK